MTDIQSTTPPFDWDEVALEPITRVLAQGAMRLSNGDLSCEQVAFVVGSSAVVLGVTSDTSEVTISLDKTFAAGEAGWHPLKQLADVASRRLGWCG